jgi:hypothetical protein
LPNRNWPTYRSCPFRCREDEMRNAIRPQSRQLARPPLVASRIRLRGLYFTQERLPLARYYPSRQPIDSPLLDRRWARPAAVKAHCRSDPAGAPRFCLLHFRCWPSTDVPIALANVCFEGRSGSGADLLRGRTLTQIATWSGRSRNRNSQAWLICGSKSTPRVCPTKSARVAADALRRALGLPEKDAPDHR